MCSREDDIVILRAKGPPLQGMCQRLRRWDSRHPVHNPCLDDDSTTHHRILPIMMEERNRCNARKDTGGRKIKQVVNYSTAEVNLNQVLCIAFARNIAHLTKNHKGIISDHQYGRAHATCVTTVLNKLLTVQLLIHKCNKGIVFDNDDKGCYARIISGVDLVAVHRLGY
jgi:hypothetical protein